LFETFFDAAIEDAKKVDQYFAQHRKPSGPLHGLPISLKDQFHVKGVETSMGYIGKRSLALFGVFVLSSLKGWLGTFQGKKGTGRDKVFESELVRELRNLGAILFCKTSV